MPRCYYRNRQYRKPAPPSRRAFPAGAPHAGALRSVFRRGHARSFCVVRGHARRGRPALHAGVQRLGAHALPGRLGREHAPRTRRHVDGRRTSHAAFSRRAHPACLHHDGRARAPQVACRGTARLHPGGRARAGLALSRVGTQRPLAIAGAGRLRCIPGLRQPCLLPELRLQPRVADGGRHHLARADRRDRASRGGAEREFCP